MKNSGSSAANAQEKKTGWYGECREELRKVVKPTREETVQATIVTVIILVFVAVVLALYDLILKNGLYGIYSAITGETI